MPDYTIYNYYYANEEKMLDLIESNSLVKVLIPGEYGGGYKIGKYYGQSMLSRLEGNKEIEISLLSLVALWNKNYSLYGPEASWQKSEIPIEVMRLEESCLAYPDAEWRGVINVCHYTAHEALKYPLKLVPTDCNLTYEEVNCYSDVYFKENPQPLLQVVPFDDLEVGLPLNRFYRGFMTNSAVILDKLKAISFPEIESANNISYIRQYPLLKLQIDDKVIKLTKPAYMRDKMNKQKEPLT